MGLGFPAVENLSLIAHALSLCSSKAYPLCQLSLLWKSYGMVLYNVVWKQLLHDQSPPVLLSFLPPLEAPFIIFP